MLALPIGYFTFRWSSTRLLPQGEQVTQTRRRTYETSFRGGIMVRSRRPEQLGHCGTCPAATAALICIRSSGSKSRLMVCDSANRGGQCPQDSAI